ncbi:aspartate/glutamate racemase family protein [Brumimicrobium aurantiacum]|uniref:Amino acid racemase n=1 Tax=Brumimicrobium aurantiacum TaxID=1737063 RepID=A0A3E1F1P5_9FLAO|nr:aspartate/glutamate racemase family protein [Brumimicrobium aurantiacum]RFC55637.1 hypothetical protein DXU93_01515 [Brumimicrobium aurantiacum]
MSKTLGILGLGSYSTLYYIEQLNKSYLQKQGGYSTFPFKMLNTNFNTINTLLPNTSSALDQIVAEYIEELEQLNINAILVPNITLHETLDRLEIQLPIHHPVRLTRQKVAEEKCKEAVVFGSYYTMDSDYLRSAFKTANIILVPPSASDAEFIDLVRRKVYQQEESPEMIQQFNEMVNQYADKHAVIIACTELSVALRVKHKHIFDMAAIQIESAINNNPNLNG